jgi:cold shock CspA family protein
LGQKSILGQKRLKKGQKVHFWVKKGRFWVKKAQKGRFWVQNGSKRAKKGQKVDFWVQNGQNGHFWGFWSIFGVIFWGL